MKRTLEAAMQANGMETQIRNIIYHLVRSNGKVELKPGAQTVCNAKKPKTSIYLSLC